MNVRLVCLKQVGVLLSEEKSASEKKESESVCESVWLIELGKSE